MAGQDSWRDEELHARDVRRRDLATRRSEERARIDAADRQARVLDACLTGGVPDAEVTERVAAGIRSGAIAPASLHSMVAMAESPVYGSRGSAADAVVASVSNTPALFKRRRASEEPALDGEATAEALGGGRPLDASIRAELEGRFAAAREPADFSSVRIHTQGEATLACEDTDARALTAGSHIAFAPGEYRPDTRDGLELLAHELSHVIQGQRRATVDAVTPSKIASLEADADRSARRVLDVRPAAAPSAVASEPAQVTATPTLLKDKGKSAAKKKAASPSKVSGTITVGAKTYELHGASLREGKAEVGTIANIDEVATALQGKTMPATITASMKAAPATAKQGADAGAASAPTTQDLVATAAEGSTITYAGSKTVFAKAEGAWSSVGKKQGKGYEAGGGGRLRDVLVRYRAAGTLQVGGKPLNLTNDEIGILDGVAQVETSGNAGGINTWDNMVISVGFKQVTLGYGSLEKIIDAAPAGFAKHGIKVDKSKTYPQQDTSSTVIAKGIHQIAGVDNVETLRRPEWAARFFRASLEPDAIAAFCVLALKELGGVQAATKRNVGAKDTNSYFQDATAKAWLLETKNNRPGFMPVAIEKAMAAGATSAASRDAFLDILEKAVIDAYVEQEPLLWYNKWKKAALGKLKKKNPKDKSKWTLSAEDDKALLDKAKKKYEPIGRKKATNIVKKISRNLTAGIPAAPTAAPPAQAATGAPAPTQAQAEGESESEP